MTIKTFSFGLVIALIAATLAAGMTIVGTHLLKEEGGMSAITNFFKSEEDSHVEFVEIKNVIVTLKSEGSKERYLLLELALTTDDPRNTKRTEDMAPAIRGATVSLLSNMSYDAVRGMDVNDLREQLLAAYSARFKSLKSSMPFKDVIISKMVFQ